MKSLKLMASLFCFGALLSSGAVYAADTSKGPEASLSPETAVIRLTSFNLNPVQRNLMIPIQSCARFGVGLTHLKLHFTGATAIVDQLAVRYGNGEVQNLVVRRQFNSGSETRWIDLGMPGFMDSRCVNALFIRGRSMRDFFHPFGNTRVDVSGMTGPMM